MSTTRKHSRSFAGGELTPEMHGRLDLPKYQTGLEECENFVVLPHGPLENRAGLEYVLETEDSSKRAKLIPFSYSTEQTYALEFGHNYIRIHTQGATLLESGLTITGITQANPGVLTYTGTDPSNGDWMYLSGIGGMTGLNGRFVKVANVNAGANTFELTDLAGANISTAALSAYTSGGTAARVYEIATPYDQDDLFDIHYVQSADVLTLTHPSYEPRELRRLGATNWQLSTIAFAPTINAPTAPTVAITTGSGSVIYQYKVTSVAEDTLEESNASTPAYSATDSISAINTGTDVITTSANHGLSVGDPVYIDGVGGTTELNGNEYLVATTPALNTLTLTTLDGAAVDMTNAYTSGGTIYTAHVKNNLATAGNKNTVTWTAVSGAIRYNVYRLLNGLYGYIGQTSRNTFVDDNIAPDTSQTPPERSNPFDSSGNYPRAVGYFDQRRCFAGTSNRPQNFWATRSATESNLGYSIPTRDNDPITFRIASREANTIRHIVPLADLLLLTSGGEWRIAPQNSDILTPSSAAPKQVSAEGANDVQPVIAGKRVVYAAAEGGRMRELMLVRDENGALIYDSNDLSLFAAHLFDDNQIVDLAYSRAPNRIVWAVRDDGVLMGCTYLPEQEVKAWHKHTTDGTFESVCAVNEGSETALYCIVKRHIDGRDVRYVERLRSRRFTALEDAFFVDSGLTYEGSATTTITGLWHLEGEEVAILADGAVHPARTVANGAITLEQAASTVHVGLPITADMKTLPLSIEMMAASGQGALKNPSKVYVSVYRSSGVKVGPDFANLKEARQRTTEPYGSPPALMSRLVEVQLPNGWNLDGQVCVRQDQPLPVTVRALVLEVAVGG